MPDPKLMEDACRRLISTIEGTGGLVPADCDGGHGLLAPAEDPEWIDLGDAYRAAKEAFGEPITPKLECAECGKYFLSLRDGCCAECW